MAARRRALGQQEQGGFGEERDSGTTLAGWALAGGPRKARARTIPDAAWERARREAEAMMRTGEWGEALPRHFVAAYALLHERVYGVADGELAPPVRLRAAAAASRCLDHEFGGDRGAMAEMVRWAWQRELEREKWRRANGRQGGKLTAWLQFGRVVTDYRLAQARRAG